MKLILGNKNYSSWSLRPWLAMKKLDLDFEEVVVPLLKPGFKEELLKYSSTGKVPVLIHNTQSIWDSLAILETLAEDHPSLLPSSASARAHARSVSAEMHSSFTALRVAMPMNCRALNRRVAVSDVMAAELERIDAIWQDCRTRYASDGPWLFGQFSIADAMYAPMVCRFNTYEPPLSQCAHDYMNTVLNDPCMTQWFVDSRAEIEVLAISEIGQ
ncbi:MAG: glutathione S-transferase [Flavobacteriales bacterium]|jgi:glutathione S-transferase